MREDCSVVGKRHAVWVDGCVGEGQAPDADPCDHGQRQHVSDTWGKKMRIFFSRKALRHLLTKNTGQGGRSTHTRDSDKEVVDIYIPT